MQITKATDSQGKEYQVVDGTHYHMETPAKLIEILEHSRIFKNRIKVTLGDTKTGKPWDDAPESFVVGRSTGPIKIPLIIHSARSHGGTALLDHCIVKVEHANKKDGGIIYDITK